MSPPDSDTVIAHILQRAAEAPAAVAFHFHDAQGGVEVISREALIRRSLDWTRAYRRAGLKIGDIVIVLIDHRPDLLFAYLGAMLGGFVPSYMPYSTAKQDRELYAQAHRKLFERIGARGVAVTREWLAENQSIFEHGDFALLLSDAVPQEVGSISEEPASAGAAEDVVLLQHSSGTTSLKKGVALSNRAVLNQMRAYAPAISVSPDDLIASWLPLYHDMGLMTCWLLPLIRGVPVAQMDPFTWAREPWRLFEMIARYRATLVWLPNFAYQHLARMVDEEVRYDLSSVRAFIDCSEPCKPETMRRFLERFAADGVTAVQLQACYAMAENGFAVTQTPLSRPARVLSADAAVLAQNHRFEPAGEGAERTIAFMSVGEPIAEVSVRVTDEQGLPLADGEVGEIAISGACLFSGYFHLPEETALAMRGDWYHTGDLGFLWEGELYVTGRLKDLIIVRGRNFYAHDIEQIVSGCAGVKPGRAVAFGVYNETLGSEEAVIVAEILDADTLDPKASRARSAEIKHAVEHELGLLPQTVRLVSSGWLVKTTSGKISRAENARKYLAEKT